MKGIDLNEFGPWREDNCSECDTVKLVTGPPDGPFRCNECWFFPKGYQKDKPKEAKRVPTQGLRRTTRR